MEVVKVRMGVESDPSQAGDSQDVDDLQNEETDHNTDQFVAHRRGKRENSSDVDHEGFKAVAAELDVHGQVIQLDDGSGDRFDLSHDINEKNT